MKFSHCAQYLKKRDPVEPLKTSVSKVELGLIKKEERVKEQQTSRCYEKWSREELLNIGEMVNSATNVSKAIACFNKDRTKRLAVGTAGRAMKLFVVKCGRPTILTADEEASTRFN